MSKVNTDFTTSSAAAEMEQTAEFSRDKLLSEAPECTKTGFSELDRLLGGGLMPGLIVLGGSPSLGKSTLALYIAEHIASEGTPVLFYSYEMQSRRIKSKLITCRNFESHRDEEDKLFNSNDLFNTETMEAWGPEKWRVFEETCQAEQPRLRNLFIIDCNDRNSRFSAKQVAENVQSFIAKNPEGKKPVVMIDYLQILPPEPRNPRDNSKATRSERQIIDDKLEAMLSLVDEAEIPVVLISSLSRAYYKKYLQMDSFKDSGGIEYSADVLLGLQFSACHDEEGNPVDEHSWNLETEKAKHPREVEILILKQRYGSTGDTIPLSYYSRYDAFVPREDDTHQEKTDEASGKKNSPSEKGTSERGSSSRQEGPLKALPANKPADTSNAQKPAGQERSDEQNAATEQESSNEQGSGNGQEKESESEIGYINITKIANLLRKGETIPNKLQKDLVLPQIGVRKSASVTYQITYLNPCETCKADKSCACAECKKYAPITGYDCNVADALYSIFRSGQDRFTLRRVLTALTGDNAQTLTEKKRKALSTSIKRLMNARITIDCTEEMNTRNYKYGGTETVFSGPLLTVIEEKENSIYRFPSERPDDLKDFMPLYAYAQKNKQIIAFPVAALQRPEDAWRKERKMSDTAEVIAIKRFLLYRLRVFQYKDTDDRYKQDFATISFKDGSELFKTLGLEYAKYKPNRALWNKKRKQISDTVRTVLELFVENGHLADYKTAAVKQKGTPPSFVMLEK